ncbi:uncharacterized protein LOC126880518 [Diabrotica virgifera virgifera]|uniref:Uncharacterized protein n=1 Tax=Diabrotica virgifera virgifera TaxID=50390 RepID=A0ABM5JR07_DIAVI|nr:uncharacterized protein LOC126880518 [Diabrotica virgifera virgifera]
MASQFSIAILTCSLLAIIAEGLELFSKTERSLNLQKLENCRGTHYPMQWNNAKVTFDKASKQKVLSVTLLVKEEISTGFWMTFSFLKCDTSGNPDSCEYMLKDQKIENICKYLGMKDQSWSEFLGCFDKQFVCPMKPDTYKCSNLSVNARSLKRLPIKDAVWKLHIGGHDKGKKISCADVEIKVVTPLGQSR